MKTLELAFFVQRSDQAGGLWLGSALQFRGKVGAFTYIWVTRHFTSSSSSLKMRHSSRDLRVEFNGFLFQYNI